MTKTDRLELPEKVFIALALVVGFGPIFLVHWYTFASMKDDYMSVLSDERYATPVAVEGVEPVEAEVSSKYAAIEMFSAWSGGDATEDSLSELYSSRDPRFAYFGFRYLLGRWCPGFEARRCFYASDSLLLKTIYEVLERGIPVPVEWSVKSDDAWQKEYALVTAMDVGNESLTLATTEGCFETLSFAEFLERMNGDAYADGSLRFYLAYLHGDFVRNTVYKVYDSTFEYLLD